MLPGPAVCWMRGEKTQLSFAGTRGWLWSAALARALPAESGEMQLLAGKTQEQHTQAPVDKNLLKPSSSN